MRSVFRLGLPLGAGLLAGCSLLLGPDEGSFTNPGGPSNGHDASGQDAATGDSGAVGGPDAADGRATPSAYAVAVLADKPIAYFRFGERTVPADPNAPHFKDEVSNTLVGVRWGTLGPGVAGALANEADPALQLNTGYVNMGERLAFVERVPFSVECWISVAAPTFAHVFTKQDRDPPKHGWAILTSAGEITFERFVDGTGVHAKSPLTVNATQFTHLAATYDGDTLRLYINGNNVALGPDVRVQAATTSPFLIGTTSIVDTAGIFQGAIDELAFYDKALSAESIQGHLAASK